MDNGLYTFTAKLGGDVIAIEQGYPECTSTTQFVCQKNHPPCTIQISHGSIVTTSGLSWACPWKPCNLPYTFLFEYPYKFRRASTFERVDDVGDRLEDVNKKVKKVEFNLQRRFTALDEMVEIRTARLEDLTDEVKNTLESIKLQNSSHHSTATEECVAANASLETHDTDALEKISNIIISIEKTVMCINHCVNRLEGENALVIVPKLESLEHILPRTKEIHNLASGLWNDSGVTGSRLDAIRERLDKLEKHQRGRSGSSRTPTFDGLRPPSPERKHSRSSSFNR